MIYIHSANIQCANKSHKQRIFHTFNDVNKYELKTRIQNGMDKRKKLKIIIMICKARLSNNQMNHTYLLYKSHLNTFKRMAWYYKLT